MNKHFSDARYYLGRAASHLKVGLVEELSPVVRRVRARVGRDVEEPVEPETRAGRVRVVAAQSKARVVDGATSAKRRVKQYRSKDEVAA